MFTGEKQVRRVYASQIKLKDSRNHTGMNPILPCLPNYWYLNMESLNMVEKYRICPYIFIPDMKQMSDSITNCKHKINHS